MVKKYYSKIITRSEHLAFKAGDNIMIRKHIIFYNDKYYLATCVASLYYDKELFNDYLFILVYTADFCFCSLDFEFYLFIKIKFIS